ncbi:SulP family inorganic anion transporter [Salinarimonas ramus]|uniref:Sodium-independent anion transporter n=1 Tax=Salinarimonas ramus TaxID=690164 RepID=A0A917Q4B1_9HYPH|nr:sulfate permease [Salinarimonas ramus]GGK19671.1 sodium-independent anion transporter [Salinarimonas ramus]
MTRTGLSRYVPILDWGRRYDTRTFTSDLVAAAIVTIMLIPQSLAYALLAGLPPVVGLYASILPLVAYAVFGTSRALAVGPVAVVSLLTAAALSEVATPGSAEYVVAAAALALMSGAMLIALGIFRLGFIANLLSHPVISGFITASGLIIAASQLKHLLGVSAGGHTLLEVGTALVAALPQTNPWTLAIGASATAFLFWVRSGLKPALRRLGLSDYAAGLVARAGPVIAVAASILSVVVLSLDEKGVAIVGDVPAGLPPLALPVVETSLLVSLIAPALLISVIGFVESVSVAQTLAAKRRQSIVPNQELIGLGAANVASAFSGGYPVTGGFARSVVNFDAGAETPAAGAFTAIGIALASLFLTPLLHYLPIATLAATIVVAVLSLVDLGALKRAWTYSRHDFAPMLATILVTLGFGVEAGILTGVALSIALLLWRTSRPHIAIVGQVPGTEHFRNVKRHRVVTDERVLSLRIDESLNFANARATEEFVLEEVAGRPALAHVVLQCTAINEIDMSALESLELIMHRLEAQGIALHLSEVKGPVMDRLARSHFVEHLTGAVYLTQHQAMSALSPALTRAATRGESVAA